MTTPQSHSRSPAIERVLATVEDAELAARYPSGTHFIDAQNPEQAMLLSRALFSGDPAVVIQPGGQEVLFTPERTHGLVALLLLVALVALRVKSRPSGGDLIQLPPRTRVEVRDASGLPLAA